MSISTIEKVAHRTAKQRTKMYDAHWVLTFRKGLTVNDVFPPVALTRKGDGKTFYCLEDIFKKLDATRILFKSGPGQSKTIICQQLLWYWYNGMSGLPIPLLVSLNPSNRDKDIRDIIMEQYPLFEGLGFTKDQVFNVIKNFGSSVLLLIDGFENENVDAQKIVNRLIFESCNVFVTSRPHYVAKYENKFDAVFVSDGFAREQAEALASHVIGDESVVKAIVDFNPGEFGPLYKCLFPFHAICILSQDGFFIKNEITISHLTKDIGVIYFKILSCWHKVVALRKGIEYNKMDFLERLKKYGKLAYELLCEESPFLVNRKWIEEMIGKDGLFYGLFFAHENDEVSAEDKDTRIEF